MNVISVENLSKSYRLGQIGTGTFAHDLNVWWAKLRGKPNPLLKIGQSDHGNRDGEEVWALKDVSFTVEQGEVLGIIGKNGAGKSTLLKILSRVTAPTSGEVKVKGRIASLLEVGTGFHPELTGRENIYLNGAILGMKRDEITRKFDEIVDFSGVEKYIDTPVKRYSSGMYVRLAFAVAAHLDPEILVVDEVLAVGDAEFQKKCLGKLEDVTHQGRTVLFVSHNMAAIKGICSRCIWINSGTLKLDGDKETVVTEYINSTTSIARLTSQRSWENHSEAPGGNGVWLKSIVVNPVNESEEMILTSTMLRCSFQFWNTSPGAVLNFSAVLKTTNDVDIFNTTSTPISMPAGVIEGTFIIPRDFLNEGLYKIRILIVKDKLQKLVDLDDAISFKVEDSSDRDGWYGRWTGVIHPHFDWSVTAHQGNSEIRLI
jgi:lipopolysaccharide transport system ATP-binding protein